jgi:hypothetical protein
MAGLVEAQESQQPTCSLPTEIMPLPSTWRDIWERTACSFLLSNLAQLRLFKLDRKHVSLRFQTISYPMLCLTFFFPSKVATISTGQLLARYSLKFFMFKRIFQQTHSVVFPFSSNHLRLSNLHLQWQLLAIFLLWASPLCTLCEDLELKI